jgi:hypothetical protein
LAAPCVPTDSVATGRVKRTEGDGAASGAACNCPASVAAPGGASEGDGSLAFKGAGAAASQHDRAGHGQQQRRLAKNRHAAAGSTSSKQTEIQTSATCVIFRSRFIASNSP